MVKDSFMQRFRARAAITLGRLKHFVPRTEAAALLHALQSEEGDDIAEVVLRVEAQVENTPVTYATEDIDLDNKVVHLHYFAGSVDAYIVERDAGDGSDRSGFDIQHQAFGLVNLMGTGIRDAELGYVSIQELIENGVELDLYWTPKTVGELKREAENGG